MYKSTSHEERLQKQAKLVYSSAVTLCQKLGLCVMIWMGANHLLIGKDVSSKEPDRSLIIHSSHFNKLSIEKRENYLAPVINCESDQTIDLTVDCKLLVPDLTDGVTVIEDCGNPGLTFTQIPTAGTLISSGHNMVHIVSISVTDACGMSAQCSVNLTGNDITSPSIVCPSDTLVACTAEVPLADPDLALASDNCGMPTVSLKSETIGNFTCVNVYTMTRIYEATDGAGNKAECSQNITVKDSVGPSIVCPRNVDVNCPLNIPNPDLTQVIVADECGNGSLKKFFIGDSIYDRTCLNRYSIKRKYGSEDECGNMKMCAQIITVTDPLSPVAKCVNGLAVQLDPTGNYTILSSDLDAGSMDNCGNQGMVLVGSDTTFNCTQIGQIEVVLTAIDACGNEDTCHARVIITELDFPALNCPPSDTIQLNSGECGRTVDFSIPSATDNCMALPVVQTDTTGLTSGSFFSIGRHCLSYEVTDLSGNKASCSFCIQIDEYPNPSLDLACHNSVQVSLNDSCWATIGAELFLVGNVYGCFDSYQVIVRDAQFPNGPWIDRDPLRPGVQINYLDVGKILRVMVFDPRTGNSCWGEATVEDKFPPLLSCPSDTSILCSSPLDLLTLGQAEVIENCGSYTLEYKDLVQMGECATGIERVITRIFSATDLFGNTGTCKQTIVVQFAGLRDVIYPPHYDSDSVAITGHNLALRCDQKFDPNYNWGLWLKPSPECVDDELLDTTILRLSGQRVPKTLGWNCIQGGIYNGHPSPYPVYYPAHPDTNSCYGSNSIVMWSGTGVPLVGGCSHLAASFTDVRIEIAPSACDAGDVGCFKILRRWTLLDWCTGQTLDTHQIIKVLDPKGPEIIYPDSIFLGMDPWRCEGHWDVAPPVLTDNCSQELHYSIELEYGTILGNEASGYIAVDIPAGNQTAYIVATDCCGNITRKAIKLFVEDLNPPTPVCEQRTVISLTGGPNPSLNTATLCAETFDDGSFDNCVPHLFFKTIRMEDLLGSNNGSSANNLNSCQGKNGDDDKNISGNQVYYDDCVLFCCDDVNKTIRVVFRVFDRNPGSGAIHPSRMNPGGDLFGRFSDCMVEVEVQNKGVPSVQAPPDIVISCSFWFDPAAITDPSDKTFGRIVTSLSDRQTVKTKDVVCQAYCTPDPLTGYPGYVAGNPSYATASNKACSYNSQFDPNHPDKIIEMVWGEDGYVLSACGSNPEITILDQRHCGPGKFFRIFSARGPNGIVVRDTQTIWVVDCDPFYINSENACDTQDDIIWPSCDGRVVKVFGCGADISPDNPLLGRPQVVSGSKDHCNLIAIENFDEIFIGEPNACYKVLRRWVVIDWCQFEPNINGPDKGRWEHLQLIEVHDQIKPVVRCIVGDCEPAVRDTQFGVCKAHIKLTMEASDTCTPQDWLAVEYKLDVYNDGFFDFTVGPLTKAQFNNGEKPVYDNNPLSDFKGNPFDASGVYPVGVHRIKWFVEDGCGNVGTCESIFEIKDCKAPSPYCKVGIITVPMQGSGCVDIWASDMDAGSRDNCTSPKGLKFYFAGDRDSFSMRVCCDEFERQKKNDEVNIVVDVWVEDEEGNRDLCTTTITVQDNLDVCPDQASTLTGSIEGQLRTEMGQNTSSTMVELHDINGLMKSMMTASEGFYGFYEIPVPGHYEIKPVRNEEHGNGVSTADIVKIQRHILGLQLLDSPYKLYAADVNRSGSITASDISEIRKLILGVQAEFTKVPSWQFIPSDYVFPNSQEPWKAPVSKILELTTDSMLTSFTSVKMGDVNNSVVANARPPLDARSGNFVSLELESATLRAGEYYKIPVYGSGVQQLAGIQFTIEVLSGYAMIESMESGAMEIGPENYYLDKALGDRMSFSWSDQHRGELRDGEVLFYLNLHMQKDADVEEIFSLTDRISSIEAITHDDQLRNVQLRFRQDGQIDADEFMLFQNTPNPVLGKQTTIYFHIPDAMPVRMTLYDVTGKIQRIYDIAGLKGLNELHIEMNEIPSHQGMLYYQMDAGQFTATRKMMISKIK